MAVLNVLKLAEVLTPPPRSVADRGDCAVVAVVPLAIDVHTGPSEVGVGSHCSN